MRTPFQNKSVVLAVIGYVRAYKPEMKFKDYELYKGVYCSLCKQLGKRYGIFARLMLSYDFTFFALMRMAVRNSCTKLTASRCSFNPAKKCVDCGDNADISYTADLTVITMYYKLMDNISDSGFFKRLLCKMLMPYAKSKYKKACRYQPEIAKKAEHFMHLQSQIEKTECCVDEAADASARMLSEMLGYNIECNDIEALKKVGYFVGRWVYLTDAVDDCGKDIKNKNFNPLKNKYSDDGFKDYARGMLTLTTAQTLNYFKKLEIHRFYDIIYNVLYDGMNCVMNKVLNGEEVTK